MAKAYNRYINTYINNKEAGVSIKQIQQDYTKLNNTIKKNLIPNTKEYNEAVAKLRSMKSVLTEHTQQVNGMTGVWKKISTEVKQFGLLALGALGAQQLVSGINNLIKRNADLSDSFADVAKTTGLTSEAVQELYKDLGKLNTRTSRKELLDLARDAGKLGITGEKNILEFVRAADKINVALGEDLGKEAITSLGKLAQQFKVVQQFGFEKSLEKIGSAVNDLGANSAAQEGYIVDFATRLAGVSKQANITIEDTLGLASTLDNLGLQSETSSTAIGQTIVAMFKDTAAFAKIAGLNTKDFSDILNKDANEALLLVLKGLKGNSEGLSTMSKKLDELGIDGARSVSVLASLAENTQLLEEQQKLANESFEKGTSLMNEFNVKNETLGAKLERVQRAISGAFINSGVVQALEAMVTAADEFINVPLSETLAQEQAELNGLVSAIITTNDNQQLRNDLIKDLQSQYPDFLKNMDAETVSNEQLRDRLAEVNDEYERRIKLTVFEEDIAEQAKKSADAYRELRDAQKDYGKAVVIANETIDKQIEKLTKANTVNGNNNFDASITALKKYKEVVNDVNLSEAERLKKLEAIGGPATELFRQNTNRVAAAQSAYNDEISAGNSIIEERNKVFQQSITEDNVESVIGQIVTESGEATEAVQKLQKELQNVQTILNGQIPQGAPGLTPAGGTASPAAREGLGGKPVSDAGNLIPSLDSERLAELQAKGNEIVGIYTTISNSISAITTTRFQNEQRMLDEAMQAEISRVEQSKMNEEQKQAALANIQEKYDKKKADMERKAMRARKASMIAMSIAQGAMAIIQSLANTTLPFPASLAGPIAIGAATAIEIGTIAKSKFARGGDTGPGIGIKDSTGHYVAGVVHDNEYVVPKRIYQDPQFADTFAMLETARTGRGFATGGDTSNGNRSVNRAGITPSTPPVRDEEMLSLMRVIARNTAQPTAIVDDSAAIAIRKRIKDVDNFESDGGIK